MFSGRGRREKQRRNRPKYKRVWLHVKLGLVSVLVWLSSASDHCSLFCLLIKPLLALSLSVISLTSLCVRALKRLVASSWENQHEASGCQLLESDWSCRCPQPVQPATGVSGILASAYWREWGLLLVPATGAETMCVPKPATGGDWGEWGGGRGGRRRKGHGS